MNVSGEISKKKKKGKKEKIHFLPHKRSEIGIEVAVDREVGRFPNGGGGFPAAIQQAPPPPVINVYAAASERRNRSFARLENGRGGVDRR